MTTVSGTTHEQGVNTTNAPVWKPERKSLIGKCRVDYRAWKSELASTLVPLIQRTRRDSNGQHRGARAVEICRQLRALYGERRSRALEL